MVLVLPGFDTPGIVITPDFVPGSHVLLVTGKGVETDVTDGAELVM